MVILVMWNDNIKGIFLFLHVIYGTSCSNIEKERYKSYTLVEKGLPYTPFSFQAVRSATNGDISPGLKEYVGQ
jgi:hypothetical protein